MTIRLNSSSYEETSAFFTPIGDFSVQAQFETGSSAYIDIEGQVDGTATPAAPWVALGTISGSDNPPIKRFAKCTNVRLRLYNNSNGRTAKAWSAE